MGWQGSPPTSPGGPGNFSTTAVTFVPNKNGAVYKGLAIANDGDNDQLYVTNFHAGTVEVYDTNFQLVPANQLAPNAFSDPNLPAGFAPFGISNIGGTLFVTYAKQNADQTDEINAPGNGFIDEFAPDGSPLGRFASGGPLNSPWGMVIAPPASPAPGFGPFSGDLLVGNFGDGIINAFDVKSGNFLGTLTDANGKDIINPGLWGLEFGVDTVTGEPSLGSPNELFFTAGGNKQNKGTFGNIQFTDPPKKKGGSGGGIGGGIGGRIY